MSYQITNNAYQVCKSINAGWRRMRLPLHLGDCYFDSVEIEPGVSIIYSNFTPKEDLIEASTKQGETTTLSFTFSLQGQSIYQPKKMLDPILFEQGRSNLCGFSKIQGSRVLQGGVNIEQYRFIIQQEAFDRYEISNMPTPQEGVAMQYSNQTISASSLIYLRRLQTLRLSQQNERPLEKKIISCNLLSEVLESLSSPNQRHLAVGVISPQDEQKLLQIYQLMKQEMHAPIAVSYLAKEACMSVSQFKAKFHKVFSKTPYQSLMDIRMSKALELLSNQYRVEQVATQVGFLHVSNFSKAFTRHYGYSPKHVSTKN